MGRLLPVRFESMHSYTISAIISGNQMATDGVGLENQTVPFPYLLHT